MNDKYARTYRHGDMVFVKLRSSRQWIPGRVIAGEPDRARVAVSVPTSEAVNWGTRWLPVNTPVFREVNHDSIYFVAAEPAWDPTRSSRS
ncbi:hypothetical protein [Amycolatopsis sp. NPDC057786]|uniref:hypothetical protein n=1 Tax=Amycolatopsis sp. NPDC057786 TaxID=3346250 RepID=UPI00366F674C